MSHKVVRGQVVKKIDKLIEKSNDNQHITLLVKILLVILQFSKTSLQYVED